MAVSSNMSTPKFVGVLLVSLCNQPKCGAPKKAPRFACSNLVFQVSRQKLTKGSFSRSFLSWFLFFFVCGGAICRFAEIWVGERAIRASAAGSPLTKGADGFGEKETSNKILGCSILEESANRRDPKGFFQGDHLKCGCWFQVTTARDRNQSL